MTKEEMLELRAMMAEVVQEENQKLRAELNAKMEAQEERLNAKIDAKSTQMLMQVAELLEAQTTKLGLQYEHEIAGKINALNEETDVIRSDVKDHEQRIHTVERKVGIAI